MVNRSFLRVTALFGVLFPVLSIAGIALQSSGSDMTTIILPTHDEALRMASTTTPTVVWLGLGLGVAATGMFAAFAAGMAVSLRGDDAPTARGLAAMASGGAAVYVALTLVSYACWAVVDERAAHGLDVQGAMVLADLRSVTFFLSWPALAVFLGSTGALVRRSSVLPTWLGWAGMAIGAGVLAVTAVPTAGIAQMVAGMPPFLWTVAVAIVLIRGRRTLPTSREAAMMHA